MTGDIFSTMINASGAAGVAVAFLWYLDKFNKQNNEMISKFNVTAHESTRVMQEVSDTNRELKDVIEKLYNQNWKLVKDGKKAQV